MKFGLCDGGTYEAKSPNAAADRCINLFPERVEKRHGKNAFTLYRTPGLRTFATLSDGPVRGLFTIPYSYPRTDRMFAVSGSGFFEVNSDGTSILHGTVLNDTYKSFMAYNGTHIAIASSRKLYLFNVATSAFSGPITDTGGADVEPISIVFLDGYFLYNIAASGRIYYSALFDGTTWDPLDFFTAEQDPDTCLVLLEDHGTLWAFGDATIQPFINTGDADNPFQPLKAGTIQQGLAAPVSPCRLDNALFWIGKDHERGGIVAWRANGTQATRVSTHSVEQFWESYETVFDAISYPMVMQGHAWWRINFPTANKTWAYDCNTNMWHELGCFNVATGIFEAHHGIYHTSAFGKHMLGDRGGDCCTAQSPNACPGITGPAILDFGDVEAFDDVTNSVFPAYVLYDPADYPGQTSVRFRATAVKSHDVFTSLSFSIVDELGTVYLTPTLTWTLIGSTGNYEALIDEVFTPDSTTAHTYYLKLTKVRTPGVLQILVPQLWIFLTESDQAKFQIPMMMGTTFDRDGSYIRNGATYARMFSSSVEPARFLKGTLSYSEIDYWQIVFNTDKDTGAGTFALINTTTGLAVAEIAVAAGDGVNEVNYSLQIADDATNFTVGQEFEFQAKESAEPNVLVIHASLYVKIGSGATGYFTSPNLCAETAEVYPRLSVSNCEDILMDRAFKWTDSEWPDSSVAYFEVTESSSNFPTLYLLDTGTVATPINPPTNITSLSFSATLSRQRSSPLSLTDGHIYTFGESAAPSFDSAAWLLFTLTGP